MSYSLFWRNPALPFTQKQQPISVPAGSVVSNACSLRFTGKGASNYGKVQQENLMRLLENFASDVSPEFPTVGQLWFDTLSGVLKVCVLTSPSPITWRSVGGAQITNIGENPPSPASLGDMWYSRTGTNSGILYVYTGVGRYPEKAYSASTYFGAISTSFSARKNTETFSAAEGSNFGEAYFHGFTSGNPADVNGAILVNSVSTVLPKGSLTTSSFVQNGLIMFNPTESLVTGKKYFSVRKTVNGWEYDNNLTWVSFTPATTDIVIGTIDVGNPDGGIAPGITNITIYANAKSFSSVIQTEKQGTAIGGWEQIYPTTILVAGREEYNYVLSEILDLAGEVGSGAIGRQINFLTTFGTLDASLHSANQEDVNLSLPSNEVFLKVNPNSQDWDKLLFALRTVARRLQVPLQSINEISSLPFVVDGRPLDANVTDSTRKSYVNYSIISSYTKYMELLNILRTVKANKFNLRGIYGTNSQSSLNAEITLVAHKSFSATNLANSPVTNGVLVRFDPSITGPGEMDRYFNSAGCVEILFSHVPSASPNVRDTDMKDLGNNKGRMRITGDKIYILNSALSPSLAQAPISTGFFNLTSVTSTLATITNGLASIQIQGKRVNNTSFELRIVVTSGGTLTGTTNIQYSWFNDTTVFNTQKVYPSLLAYTATDKLGSTDFS